MPENFPKIMTKTSNFSENHRYQCTPSKMNSTSHIHTQPHRHFIFKLLKIKDIEEGSKVPGQKRHITYRESYIRNTAGLYFETSNCNMEDGANLSQSRIVQSKIS